MTPYLKTATGIKTKTTPKKPKKGLSSFDEEDADAEIFLEPVELVVFNCDFEFPNLF